MDSHVCICLLLFHLAGRMYTSTYRTWAPVPQIQQTLSVAHIDHVAELLCPSADQMVEHMATNVS